MNKLQTLTTLSATVAIGAFTLLSPTISLAEQIASDSAEINYSDCIATDVKGSFQYSGNHVSGNPVKGFFENIASNPTCSDDVYVHIFGSNTTPEADGWFDSQVHLATQTYTIPQGSNQNVEISLPATDYCWYQVDATRTSEVRIPPVYHGNDMIDYVFVRNASCDVTPTPTATPSATPTNGPTPTPGSSNNNNSTESTSSTKTVESIQASLGTTTMPATGGFPVPVANAGLITGMIVSALGALSYAKDKKNSRSF